MSTTFKAAVDTLVRDFRASERMPGVERITVPGERSEETRVARARDGIPIAPALMRSLDQLAGELGNGEARVAHLLIRGRRKGRRHDFCQHRPGKPDLGSRLPAE